MQITIYPFPAAIAEKQYYNKTVIVVDVLRASTSMVEALQNGAIQLVPARDAGEAMAFSVHLGRKESLLAGESGGLRLNGFDLGNSPLEYKKNVIFGKTVVFCTTNGTGAIHAARTAALLLIGCMRNRKAVAEYALAHENDILILCAGTHGECSIDDMIAAGAIYNALKEGVEGEIDSNDFAKVCAFAFESFLENRLNVSMAKHYQTLKKLGFDEDLSYCFMLDKTDCVPKYDNGSIRNANG